MLGEQKTDTTESGFRNPDGSVEFGGTVRYYKRK